MHSTIKTGRRALVVLAVAASAVTAAPVVNTAAAAGSDAPQVQIRTFADKCLDVYQGRSGDETPIFQYACHGSFNQRFKITEVGNGEVEIRTFADKCLDVYQGRSSDETGILQVTCHGSFNQRFKII
ncbi:RICIN domain-containing protein [Streptomyces stelliscabiei]|uniref:Ricin B lectin domain-containing protein n=1 Tax=Streptomyces stelliscabiei TaxID=146820 RepID=A0A8I0P1N9_9ACTN|nr:RICIN domain-containing protein [Streptomyces stelliscabiei]KND45759.1 hypothetical protein IQ64_04830 [Streptomyces stelliscabiei]MBE1597986.1 hypothetical protein [Streptomyces stelliscabiei]MDX2515496.1 RICIN domain-containing protein [Streptomyces stelliscabiei]MDX2552089.1 RICIN domain-containing protein [Streptomyces stelliscabiei]MDX2609543.1 RICIN domain-containing protein [Streptomyces stelliscabiei]